MVADDPRESSEYRAKPIDPVILPISGDKGWPKSSGGIHTSASERSLNRVRNYLYFNSSNYATLLKLMLLF